MRPKSLILLALALGCGLIASIGISQVMDKQKQAPGSSLETAPIYVALHNINLGDPIDASMVALQEWPKDRIPAGAIASLEDLEGRRPRSNIIEGMPLLEVQLLAPGQVADPILHIPHGFRLKTLSVDATKSAAGLLNPGDRVDIQLFVQRNERSNIPHSMTKVILQNIRVYAIDQEVQRSGDGGEARTIAKTVSLLVTPEQANKITLGERLGEVSLIPRNPDDDETVVVAEATTDDLFADGGSNSRRQEQVGGGEKEAAEGPGILSSIMQMVKKSAEERPPFRMEIVEAADVREMLFDAGSGRPIRDIDSKRVSTQPVSTKAPATTSPEPTGGIDPSGLPGFGDNSKFPIDFGDGGL